MARYLAFLLLSICLVQEAVARDLRASLAAIDKQAYYDEQGQPKGAMVDLINALDDLYLEGSIQIEIAPFARSLNQVATGAADFHMPLIKLPHLDESKKRYRYIKEPFGKVAFVAYTNSMLDDISSERYDNSRMATIAAHKHFFPFKTIELKSIPVALKMLEKGRIDVFLMEQDAVDRHLREISQPKIRRALYQEWETYFVVGKRNPKSASLDNLLSRLIRELSKTGKLKMLVDKIHKPYTDWQPSQQ